jgi:thioesterase domain-containing protein
MSSPHTRAHPEDPAVLEVERYLHHNIPLSAAMGVRVKIATPRRVELAAPFAPNLNHQSTVFGGSASAVAMLSAWTLVHLGLRREGIETNIVVQHSAMRFEAPMHGEFTAVCALVDDEAWRRFVRTVERHGRGRITMHAHLLAEGRPAASFEGDFVALRPRGDRGQPPGQGLLRVAPREGPGV